MFEDLVLPFSNNMESEREAECALRRRYIGAMTFT